MKKKIKIILLEDIPQIGRKFEIFEVTLGYYRNYLLPKGLANIATDKVLKQLKGERKKVKESREKRVANNKEKSNKLEGTTYTFVMKAGARGHVYGSVTADDIAKKVVEDGYENIDINLTHPLKKLGEEQVWVDFGDDIRTSVNIILQKEEDKQGNKKTQEKKKEEKKEESKKEEKKEESTDKEK